MKAVKRDAREMKDSGIEWIGEIPKAWVLDKLKHYGTHILAKFDLILF